MLVPKLRFKREDGTDYSEWEEDTIGNCVNVTSCKRVHQSDWTDSGVPFYRAREIVALYNNEPITPLHISIEKYNALSKISGMISSGDLLVTGVGTIGVPYLVKESDKFYFKDGNIIWFQNEEKRALGSFLYYTLSTNEFQTKILQDSGKGTVHTFTIANAKETIIAIPCLEEQQKIADFLSTVDEVIAQSESEVQNLEQQKKAAMQKIFSQEVRFKREDGTDYPEWEEKALSDISEFITKGTTPKKYSENGGVNFVQINSIVDGAINTDKCLRIDEETHNGFLSRSVLFENDILCSIAGALGVIAVVNKDVLPANTNQALAIIRLNEGCNHRYIAFALSSYVMEKYIKQCKTVGAQPNLSLAQIRDMIVPFPCLKEQQKIADFLSAYDEAISYAKQELDKWKELKKGLLQQMFV